MKVKIKTVDVNCLEWFDKVNGNSYFAGSVTTNYGMMSEENYKIPFQYGYGDSYRYKAFEVLQNNKAIPKQDDRTIFWRYYQDKNIIVRHSLKENCKKRELMQF